MAGVILASRSAARADLLAGAGVSFTLQVAEVDEPSLKRAAQARAATPKEIALDLALAKAKAVKDQDSTGALVLGADQTLELDGVLFDKPVSLADARRQLLALRGRVHHLHCAVACLQDGEPAWSHVASASLYVRPFSEAFLDGYLADEGEALLGCVGAYRLEGRGAQLFGRIEGDYFTILGLPLLAVLDHLRACGRLPA